MSTTIKVLNYINGSFQAPSTGEFLDVINPADDTVIGQVAVSAASDVDQAVTAASQALPSWSSMTIKARAAIMLRFHALIRDNAQELAELIVAENGKNITEALADVAKGNETVEYACSLPQLAQGRSLQVSGQVYCEDRREPVGVISSIVPFNFPVRWFVRRCRRRRFVSHFSYCLMESLLIQLTVYGSHVDIVSKSCCIRRLFLIHYRIASQYTFHAHNV